ncbi:MAG: immunoglobulin domain-containing protein, partial [Verrucomicrobia bacterium]|nr:immunoglobulin domain-containing protein [Verrucomicrobiota bacterium]
FAVDTTSPLLIGTGSIIGAGYGGSEAQATLDEVALYTNVLTADQVAAHYAATSGNYATTVLADGPTIYLRLDEPPLTNYPDASTYPVANNYGSLGAAANGLYQPGTTPGVAGPPFAGFGAGSRAVAFNGFNGAVDIGGGNLPAALNPTNNAPFTVTAWFQGNPADALTRYQEMVGHGAGSSYELGLDDNSGGAVFNPGNGPTLQFANTLDAVTNVMVMNDGQWHMAAAVSDGTTASLYLDGVQAKTSTGVGAIAGNPLDLMIGGDPRFMVPLANGDHNTEPRFFDGQIAQVAWFTNALTAAQIQQLYGAAGVPPFIAAEPQSGTNNAGSTVTLSVGVRGSSPIAYQWYQNGSPVTGATSASLVLTSAPPADAGSYYVVANNSYGAVTSAVVQLTIYGAPTVQEQSLTGLQVFAGSSPTLRLTAIGPAPLSYQWTLNGSPIAGATAATYVVGNVQSGGSYGCTVSNAYGSATITPIALAVAPAPTAAYPAAVLADKPMAFYRLDETSGSVAYDYVGGFNATYTNVLLGQQPGYSPNDPTEPAAVFGNLSPADSYAGNVPAYLNFAAPAGDHSEFSIEAWVNGGFGQNTDAGIVALGYGNGGEQFDLDTGGADPQHDFRFFVRDAGGSVHAATGSVGPNDNAWHHVVAVCDEIDGQINLYVDGVLNAGGSIGATNGILASTTPLSIGSRQSGNGTAFDNQFVGSVSEVAVYDYALSSSQVLAHYYASGVAPAITVQPTNIVVNQGSTVQIVAAASGTPPLAYQWYDVTSGMPALVTGQTNATLTLANVPASDSGHTFQLTVTNLFGQVTSNPAQLTVVGGAPVLGVDVQPLLATVDEGTSMSYSVVVSGTAPLIYQWTLNGNPILGATNATYSFTALVGTNTYAVTVSNGLGSVTSSTATLIGLPVPKLDPTGYAYKLKIGFPGYNKPDSLTNFPALVRLGTNITGFAYQQFALPAGGDLRFTDSSGDRMIPFEIDQWND